MNQNSKRATSDRHRLIFTLQAISGERPARLILWEDWVFPTFEVKLNRKETPLSASARNFAPPYVNPPPHLSSNIAGRAAGKRSCAGPYQRRTARSTASEKCRGPRDRFEAGPLDRQQGCQLIEDALQSGSEINQTPVKQLTKEIAKQLARAGLARDIDGYWAVGAIVEDDI